ncbi:hypothetical protein SEA_TELAVIV_115 [Mycobacterium phage TelAviv]|nr:hypothetical protein SEA_FAMILTON_121 [Mycobacterium phage Familton]AVI04148.1 hypothetical protein SEA_JANGDYNASTY_117 [Mycobacterium phage JangDynasty]AVP42775.1 hypothetical protein SEA_SCHOOLBUS_120 [Mycobacterium phage SchoolBus]QOC58547.1 hypothetical protein SEA_SHIDA_118 [Mycobacterium phage Shida]QPO16601.1 hypothetical protein SEA_TELAVIV_115 [Mycobacterium phage TelAviv]URM87894.1 hypothetical protein SEA_IDERGOLLASPER_123 [Mycobacterium phage Idergollasper]
MMARHRDYGGTNDRPLAYVGIGGDLYRQDYRDSDGSARVYRAEYGLAQRHVTLGDVFVRPKLAVRR